MSTLVSKDFVEINGSHFNLSFITIKGTSSPNPSTYFFRRISWDDSTRVPKTFFTLDLGTNGTHIYCPWGPFHLQEDECSPWLQWSTEKPSVDGDEIKMLKFRGDPRTILQDSETKFGISAFFNHSLWAEQQSNQQLALGNLTRNELVTKTSITQTLRHLPNTIINYLRKEQRERDRSRDRRHSSRSPEPKRPRKDHDQTSQFPVIPQQQIQPQLTLPQQYFMQPQLTQQQLQWNAALNGTAGGQTPAGLLYAPPRT